VQYGWTKELHTCWFLQENISPDATHDYISNIFSEYGKVVYISLPKFHGTHSNKGFAFVEFDTPEEAAKALQVRPNFL